jgi:hypothetical protein
MPCGLEQSAPQRPHISWALPLTSCFPPTSLFQPLCYPQQASLSEQPKLKRTQSPSSNFLTSPPPNRQHIRLARHYYSRRSLTSTFQYKPSPKFTPKTPSLCQAKPRSRISRAAVRHFALYSPFGERVPPCLCRCNGSDGRDTVDGYVGLGATERFHFATTATTRPRIGIQHEAASLTHLIFRPLRRSRRRLGTDYPNPRIHPYSHPAA